MSFLTELISKEKKLAVEELFSEMKEEFQIFEELVSLHQKKADDAKRIIQDWNSADLSSIDKSILDMLQINQRLIRLIRKASAINEKEMRLFYFIMKQKMNSVDKRFAVYKRQEDLMEREKYKEYSEKLEPFFEQLFGFLKTLSKILREQNNAINRSNQLIAKDLIEKSFFYQLLLDEVSMDRKIKQNIIFIIRTINNILGYKKRWLVTRAIETGKGRKEIIAKGLVFYELRDVDSVNFNRFYSLYEDTFPQIEAEPKQSLKDFFKYAEVRESISDGVYRTHLIVGVLGNDVVAFIYFNTLFIKENNLFCGYVWYVAIAEEFRDRRILDALFNRMSITMKRDANEFGFDDVDAVFTEVSDPDKMTSEEDEECKRKYMEEPKKIFNMWKGIGYVPVAYDHISPSTESNIEPVRYETMMVKPFKEEWLQQRGIPVNDMKKIIDYYVKWLYDQPLARNRVYLNLLRNIDKAQANGLIKFG